MQFQQFESALKKATQDLRRAAHRYDPQIGTHISDVASRLEGFLEAASGMASMRESFKNELFVDFSGQPACCLRIRFEGLRAICEITTPLISYNNGELFVQNVGADRLSKPVAVSVC